MPPDKQFKIISLSLIAAAVLFPTGVYFAAKGLANSLANTRSESMEANALAALSATTSLALFAGETLRAPESIFGGLNLEARAVFVYDVEAGRALYNKDADIPLPLASLAKIMTALLASEAPETGESAVTVALDGFETFEIPIAYSTTTMMSDGTASSTTVVVHSKNTVPVKKYSKWNLRDLLDYTLLVSFNEGAEALAMQRAGSESAFVTLMNERAGSLGLATFAFKNASGLDIDERVSGAYGSARDVVRLIEHVLKEKPELLRATTLSSSVYTTLDGEKKYGRNTNPLAENIPGLLASKTGYTDLAGGNLAIAYNAGPIRPIIIVVLGSTKDARFTDVEKLIDASLKAMAL